MKNTNQQHWQRNADQPESQYRAHPEEARSNSRAGFKQSTSAPDYLQKLEAAYQEHLNAKQNLNQHRRR